MTKTCSCRSCVTLCTFSSRSERAQLDFDLSKALHLFQTTEYDAILSYYTKCRIQSEGPPLGIAGNDTELPIVRVPWPRRGMEDKQEQLAANKDKWFMNHRSVQNKEYLPELFEILTTICRRVEGPPNHKMAWDMLAADTDNVELLVSWQKRVLKETGKHGIPNPVLFRKVQQAGTPA
jgi:hypothetical protein